MTDQESPDVILPITAEAFDSLVAEVCDRFKIPFGDLVEDGVATAIMHIPAGKAYAPISYFGNAARQNLAKLVAFNKLNELQEKRRQANKASTPPKTEPADGQSVQNPPVQASIQGMEPKAGEGGS